MTLREQLAKRMRRLWIEDAKQQGAWDLIMADEVIRQMEWVRREFYRGDHSYHDNPGVAPIPAECPKCLRHNAPLTLAPEDWKPNEKAPE